MIKGGLPGISSVKVRPNALPCQRIRYGSNIVAPHPQETRVIVFRYEMGRRRSKDDGLGQPGANS